MEHLTVTILEREYRLACTPEEKDSLLRCAEYVDGKMQAIRSAGKVMGADRIAVMAALQIAHELFSARSGDGIELGDLRRRVRDMLQSCDDALLPQEKLF
ncbi:MAG TPA: cell division protein ZapA [Burkholderiaceae bacterium]|jgi:cell division protein ZapA|nr:cell division protein ZapA [Burkholderiaceae bacterium]